MSPRQVRNPGREAKARMRLAAMLFATGLVVGCGERLPERSPDLLPGTTAPDAGTSEAGTSDAGTSDAGTSDAGTSDAGTVAAVDPGPALLDIPGWSTRKRLRNAAGHDVLLEEQLTSFAAVTGATRVRRIDPSGSAPAPWAAPSGLYIEDLSLHPSGAISVVLVDDNLGVWLARLRRRGAARPGTAARSSDRQRPDGARRDGPHRCHGERAAPGLGADRCRRRGGGRRGDHSAGVGDPLPPRLLHPLGGAPAEAGAPGQPSHPVPSHRGELRHLRGDVVVVPGAGRRRRRRKRLRRVLGRPAEAPALLGVLRRRPRIRSPPSGFPGDSDVLLEKLDRAGSRLWVRVVGTSTRTSPTRCRAAHGGWRSWPGPPCPGRGQHLLGRAPQRDRRRRDASGDGFIPALGLEHLPRRRRAPRRRVAGGRKRRLVPEPLRAERSLLRHQAPHRAALHPRAARCASRSPPVRATTRSARSSPTGATSGSAATRTGR